MKSLGKIVPPYLSLELLTDWYEHILDAGYMAGEKMIGKNGLIGCK